MKIEMNNQRGILITNILSKFFDRVIYTRNKMNPWKGISEHQNGSMEKRSIYDNLFTLRAIIDDNKCYVKDTCILIEDAKNI